MITWSQYKESIKANVDPTFAFDIRETSLYINTGALGIFLFLENFRLKPIGLLADVHSSVLTTRPMQSGFSNISDIKNQATQLEEFFRRFEWQGIICDFVDDQDLDSIEKLVGRKRWEIVIINEEQQQRIDKLLRFKILQYVEGVVYSFNVEDLR